MERFRQFRIFANRFFLSVPFLLSLVFFTTLVPIFECELQATMVYICLVSLLLLICDDILTVFLPVLLVCTFLTRCYDCYNQFIPYKFWLLPLFVALILHFCLYHQKIRLGETFPGLCAVSVAVTAGVCRSGFGESKLISLYYLLGLGFGMLAIYLLLRSQLKIECSYDIKRKFAVIMTLTGVFVFICIAIYYIKRWGEWKEIQSGNNLATLLLLAMPFPAWLSLKKKRWLPLLFLFFAGTVLSASRSGALIGAAEFLLCLCWLAFFDRKFRYCYVAVAAGFVALGIFSLPYVAYYLWKNTRISFEESFGSHIRTIHEFYGLKKDGRLQMILRAKDDFLSNPLFGRGLFYRGNEDVYHPKTGALNWYHLWFAQIIGSMGIVGVLAYGYQLAERIVVTVRHRSEANWFLFLSYMGLFLMSQVNPGEFCPFPYTALAVIIFILIEDGPLLRKTAKSKKEVQNEF